MQFTRANFFYLLGLIDRYDSAGHRGESFFEYHADSENYRCGYYESGVMF